MALIYCPECGKQISDRAAACPHCGFPMNSNKKVVSLFKSDKDSLKSQYDAIITLLQNSDGVDADLVKDFASTHYLKTKYWAAHNYEKIVDLVTLDNISNISENPEHDYERLKPLIKECGNMSLGNTLKRYEKENHEFDSIGEIIDREDGKIVKTGIQLTHREYYSNSFKSVTIRFYTDCIVCIEYASGNTSEITYENLEYMNLEQGFSGIDSKGDNVRYDLSSVHASIFNMFIDELEKRGILQNELLKEKIKKSNIDSDVQKTKTENVAGEKSEEQPTAAKPTGKGRGFQFDLFHKRKKLSRDTYMKIYGLQCSKALCDKKGEYLAAFEGRKDFFELEKAYNALPGLYNQYASSILSTQLKMTSPISPYAAAAIGTFIGGTAVGIVAAVDAKEKQKTVADNNKRALEIEAKQKRCQFNLNDCYECVEYYILQNENTAEDWKRQLNSIAQEMNQEYKITK